MLYGSIYFNIYLQLNLLHSVTVGKTQFIQPEPTNEPSATVAAVGGFVGGMVFGILATLLVVGIVLGAVRMKRKVTARK